ncbi:MULTISPECIES: LytTR family DNA-binding domain-containing protein [unclassified Fusibacter]|uniref:LytR/AlgR family response regulator transcription factor n=1 Tax=unclassified Fusibacter TaxID=2624464 RepID=UPI0013E9569B|nr:MULTISPECIES: LytTR family DNA-binding domain-containing protein [unclassified Fusibacter]MCK8059631.1 LytTR family DNA-binding domain-containing protein [Fusibacter sp. A2]NPE21432.1 response regulator transcription factor [Fusibacter sp. A1]
MLKTIVVDDQQIILDSIVSHIKKLDYVKLICSTTSSADSKRYFESSEANVAILDIDMPEIDGLTLAQWINQNSPQTKLIFCTSHGAYIKDAFRVYAYDFIEKPIDFERLTGSLYRLNQNMPDENKVIEVHTEDGSRFVSLPDLVAIEAQGKHCILYTTKSAFEVKDSFKTFESLLSNIDFYKSSRSYIVNLKQVEGLEKLNRTSYMIKLKNPNAYAQLSKKSYEEFKEQLTHSQSL